MRISDWSSDVCSSDLGFREGAFPDDLRKAARAWHRHDRRADSGGARATLYVRRGGDRSRRPHRSARPLRGGRGDAIGAARRQRSEEHTSELQSLMRISYAVFCLKKKNKNRTIHTHDEYNLTYQKTTITN